MTVISTNLRNTREAARLLRVEPVGRITQTNVQRALEEISDAPEVVLPTPVTFAMSPYVPLSADTALDVDTSGGAVVINMPAASARSHVPLVVKDSTGHAATNNITINPNGAETIEGLTSYPINVDFGGIKLSPRGGTGYLVGP